MVNNFIKQQIEKGFSQYIYDFKYPDLSTIAYNHLPVSYTHLDVYKRQSEDLAVDVTADIDTLAGLYLVAAQE